MIFLPQQHLFSTTFREGTNMILQIIGATIFTLLQSPKVDSTVINESIPIAIISDRDISQTLFQTIETVANKIKPKERKIEDGFTYSNINGVVYAIDRKSLGIEFLASIVKGIDSQLKSNNPSLCSKELQEAILPLLSTPYQKYPVVSMNNVEITTGLYVNLVDENSGSKSISMRNTPKFESDPHYLDLKTSWKSTSKNTSIFSIRNVSVSLCGNFRDSREMREVSTLGLNLAWDEYEEVKSEYNYSLDKLKGKLVPGTLPFYPDIMHSGKKIGELDKEVSDKLIGMAFDISSPYKDWSNATITTATAEICLNATFLLEDGSTIGLVWILPNKLP
ncbi:MAG: hypothetical protein ACKVQS_04220 [Fimbriimonadaceae bacterium]